MSHEPEGDGHSWTCSCGEEHGFDETPREGQELECEACGAFHEIESIEWSAMLYFKRPEPGS